MRSKRFMVIFTFILTIAFVLSKDAHGAFVNVVKIQGVINPASAEFLKYSIKKSDEEGSSAIIIQLDTPGGLQSSMEDMVKDIMNSPIPIVVYVAPSGARAFSAGVFITMAAHIAAMAPGTSIGAAHPVAIGSSMDKEMAKKAVNAAVSYIRSLAQKRGRNADWAENAVRNSISATAEEAMNQYVIDLIATDIKDLLNKIDGKVVSTTKGKLKIVTAGVEIKYMEMGLRHRILNALSDPNIAYILLLLGFYGLFFELASPGAVFPGVIGAICLILAFYALQTLPVNYAGVLLIILAIILFIAEIKVVSHGLLTLGGIVSMILGSLLLFHSSAPYMRVSLAVIIPSVLMTAGFFIFALGYAIKAQMKKPATGMEGLMGEIGVAHTDIEPEGKVFVHGEYWNAFSSSPIKKGNKVKVKGIKDMKLEVEPFND